MGVVTIYCSCPKCGQTCGAKPLDYDRSLGRFYCDNCDILGTVDIYLQEDDDEEVG